MIVSSDGIILACRKFGDTSRIAAIFTEEFGLIKTIAKGSRNPKSKLNAALSPLNVCQISYYNKKNTELHLISNAEKKYSLNHLISNFENLNYGLMIAESITNTIEPASIHKELYKDTETALNYLNNAQYSAFVIFLKHQFLLAKDLGFDFDFSASYDEDLIYNIEQSSFYDAKVDFAKNAHKFNVNTIKLLNFVFSNDYKELDGIIFSADESSSIIEFLSKYFSYHLEKNYNYLSYKLLK